MSLPRAPIIRWSKVLTLTTHLFISATLITFLAAQVIAPNLDSLVSDLDKNRGEVRIHVIGDYLLKLSITSTYIWLLVFYGFFHCFLNLTAELLRFGDRGKCCKSFCILILYMKEYSYLMYYSFFFVSILQRLVECL